MGEDCAKSILKIMNPDGLHYDGEVVHRCPTCGDPTRVYRRIAVGDTSGLLPCSLECRCEIEAERLARCLEAKRRISRLKMRAYRGSGISSDLKAIASSDLDVGLRQAADLVLGALLDKSPIGVGITLSCKSSLGRRRFSCAVVNALCEAGLSVGYVSVQAFLRAIKATYGERNGGETESSLIQDRLSFEVLIVDGLGECRSGTWLRGILGELIAGARRAGRTVIATTGLSREELRGWLGTGGPDGNGLLDQLLQSSPFLSVECENFEREEERNVIEELNRRLAAVEVS